MHVKPYQTPDQLEEELWPLQIRVPQVAASRGFGISAPLREDEEAYYRGLNNQQSSSQGSFL